MSYAAGQLGWAVYEYRDAFEKSGQLDDILDEIKWATDFFIKAHPSPNVLYYMCGYEDSDHSVWIPHELLDYKTDRKSFKVDTTTPGSDVAAKLRQHWLLHQLFLSPQTQHMQKPVLHMQSSCLILVIHTEEKTL